MMKRLLTIIAATFSLLPLCGSAQQPTQQLPATDQAGQGRAVPARTVQTIPLPLPGEVPAGEIPAGELLPGETELPPLARTIPVPISKNADASPPRLDSQRHLAMPSVARQVSNAMADSVEKILPAVVVVKTSAQVLQRDIFRTYLSEKEIGQGSGVIIDPRGYLITNRHVLMEAETVRVQLSDGREFKAEFIDDSAPTDLAVLKIKAPAGTVFTAAEFADSDKVRVGELAMAIGSPYGFNSSVTHGIISQKGRGWEEIPVVDFIQTSASINPGNSGGALVDVDGRLIGINTFIKTAPDGGKGSIGIGFAVPSNVALRVAEMIMDGKPADLAYLGIFMGQTPYGVMITRTKEEGPAARGGLKAGDLVREIDGKTISTTDDFRTYMSLKKPGDAIKARVIRGERLLEITVKTEDMPELRSLIKE